MKGESEHVPGLGGRPQGPGPLFVNSSAPGAKGWDGGAHSRSLQNDPGCGFSGEAWGRGL